MSSSPLPPNQRDGTSQDKRLQLALDPGYISVDERSIQDLLKLAQAYAANLNYFDVSQGEVKPNGKWDKFLPPNLEELVEYIEHPERFTAEAAARFNRPHIVLFVTFLKLMSYMQAQMNTLTKRHLDYYYQQVLRMSKRLGVPDQVNILVDLAAGVDHFSLPTGTLLDAGVDSTGQTRHYQTTHNIEVSRAQIGEIKSLYVDKQITGLQEVRKSHVRANEPALLPMLELALGNPMPGDPVRLVEPAGTLNLAKLAVIENLIDFLRNSLYLDNFTNGLNSSYTDFRTLMQLQKNQENSADDWEEIRRILERAGKARTNNENFVLPENPINFNPKDFDSLLIEALGLSDLEEFGKGISQVVTVYDLYALRGDSDVRAAFDDEQNYGYWDFDEFLRMMHIKVRIDGEWDEIHRILQAAWQRMNPDSSPDDAPQVDPKIEEAFDELVKGTFGTVDYGPITEINESEVGELGNFYDIVDLGSLATTIHYLETSFYMPAEQIAYCLRVADSDHQATEAEWTRVEQLLDRAHKDKVYSDRVEELRQIGGEPVDLRRMLKLVVGEAANSRVTDLEQVLEVLIERDAQFLSDISSRFEKQESINLDEWERVFELLERAWRIMQKFPTPIPQKVTWLNLFPTEDATALTVSLALEGEEETPRWRTFGFGVSDVRSIPPPTSFGWAIQSPMLSLSGGVRTITLTLGFNPDQFDKNKIEALLLKDVDDSQSPFLLQLSSENGWLILSRVAFSVGNYEALTKLDDIAAGGEQQETAVQITFTLDESVPPIVPQADDQSAISPTCRLLLKPIWDEEENRYQTHYTPFKNLRLAKAHLRVDVTRLQPTHLQNDESALKPNKPFEPFGNTPSAGSRLNIGHPELAHQVLDSLSFQVEWMGLPSIGLAEHYKNYPAAITDEAFKTIVILKDRQKEEVLAANAELFDESGIEIGAVSKKFERLISPRMGDDLLKWDRFVQWELVSPDFQHAVYPSLAAQKALALAAAIANKDKITASDYQVNPPYTPKIKSLTIGYSTSVEIETFVYSPDVQFEHLYHVEPFGRREMTPHNATFLPIFDHEGVLYIGIKGAKPPQNLSILFQMAEGSADPDLEPMPIQWHYLSGNRWLSLEDGKLLGDTTRGLINSGIVTVKLQPTEPNTLLTPEQYWLRATIPQHSRSVADTVALHTQAVSAVFVDQNNAEDHLSQPLPPDSISDLVRRQPSIKGIRQPYTSFGGKMAEMDLLFYTRISERLRHKQRALTLWDYEHLVLERFPEIYKVKCLPAQPDQPGTVTVVVIPDIRHKRPFNPFAPKAPANLIADIQTYLYGLMPPSATVKVKNAVFVPVKARFGVRLREGYSEGFYFNQLNIELRRFLSPWAYADTPDVEIGGRIYANVIVNFIEERPYVDYVAKIKLFTDENGRVVQTKGNDAYIEAIHPDGVLVSDLQHEIDLISHADFEEEKFTGINYMKIELDFIVG